ncbi:MULTISPECIES: asparagine synthase (glutamine-hydrolyzing) [unclassified Microbacterium]|uniref:asparagine synthase (glutamine-hydrolyzing) n=1 Tax=unclassified Microbacterium TaxID=2609290 RepID=UPI000ACFA13D|nr:MULTISPECIES: asparagine synthase (glutamine-hydrolyzing) [unclassified Microbacterium]
MCGICGVRDVKTPPNVDDVRPMVGVLSHRGPDSSGFHVSGDVTLGHARLSIVDVAGGAQPLANEDDTVWVTFNGEIYNYVELTAELSARGHRFRTRSDTEVIVHAWEEWGLSCFARFNGQWAIAIHDQRSRELILSRDPFGIHPLFHATVGSRLRFASEVKALFADSAVPREFDPAGFAELLTFWAPVAPRTVFRGVQQVEPGTCLVYRHGATTPERHRFWYDEFATAASEQHVTIDESAAALRASLIDATRLRFTRSDVPVAAYLSGGIDSTVTAGIIRHHTGADLRTYSLRFADSEFDEGDYQRTVSDALGTDHRDITVTGADIAGVFPEVIRHTETPILRSGPAPMYLLSKLVRGSGRKVVVTGEGSDEMLAGYDIFREAAVRRYAARHPGSPWADRAVDALYPWMQRAPQQAPVFARSFFMRNLDADDPAISHRPRWDTARALTGMLQPAFSGAGDPAADLVGRMPAGSRQWHPLARAQWLEWTTLLPGYVLSSQGDRMLMANSVEGRFPFLDPNVARVAARMPARHKLRGLDEKHVLKRAFADIVPQEVLERPKQPYRAPDASSFFGPDAPGWVSDALAPDSVQAAGVFQPEIVQRLAAKCARTGGRGIGNSDNMRVLAVLSTQLLYNDVIRGHGGTS